MVPTRNQSVFPRQIFRIGLFVFIIALLGNALSSHEEKSNANTSTIATAQGISGSLEQEVAALPLPNLTLAKRTDSPPRIFSRSYILIPSDTKYPLVAKEADKQVSIASTTKMMTALVALENYSLNQVTTISSQAARTEGSEIQLLTNEKISVENLLYALLLNSANDSAVALSQVNGTTEDFVAKMNKKAKDLGLRNTHYADPSGLSTESMSTPRDLALILDYALDNPTFRKIIGTNEHVIWSADEKYTHELKSSNRLIQPDELYYLPSSIGGKTGFTYEAGHCLVVAAESNGKRYIAAVLYTHEDTKEASAKEARKLLSWAIQQP